MHLMSFVDYRFHSEICKKTSGQHAVRPIGQYCVCKQTSHIVTDALHFAKFIHARSNMMSCVFLSRRILNKIKDYTVFPILWVNEVSINKASISLKKLGPVKAYRSNKTPIITLAFTFLKAEICQFEALSILLLNNWPLI